MNTTHTHSTTRVEPLLCCFAASVVKSRAWRSSCRHFIAGKETTNNLGALILWSASTNQATAWRLAIHRVWSASLWLFSLPAQQFDTVRRLVLHPIQWLQSSLFALASLGRASLLQPMSQRALATTTSACTYYTILVCRPLILRCAKDLFTSGTGHAPTPCLRTLSTRTDVMKSSLIKKADSYRVPLKGTDTTVCVAVQLPHVPKPLYHTLSLRLCCVFYCTTQIHMLVDNANHVYVQLCNHHHHHHHHHYHHKHTPH